MYDLSIADVNCIIEALNYSNDQVVDSGGDIKVYSCDANTTCDEQLALADAAGGIVAMLQAKLMANASSVSLESL